MIKQKINTSGLGPNMQVMELETLDLIKKFKSNEQAAPPVNTNDNQPTFLQRIFGG